MLEGCVPWPAEAAARHRAAGYWLGKPFGDLLDEWAAPRPAESAVVDSGERLSYAELAEASARLGTALVGLGLGPGARVVVQLPNIADFVVAIFGCFRVGVVPIMALPAHRETEISHLLAASEAIAYLGPGTHRGFDHTAMALGLRARAPHLRHILVGGEGPVPPGTISLRTLWVSTPADRALLAARRPAASEVALFQLSGGTTGLAKLIPRTHDDYAYNARACAEVARLRPESVYLITLPVSHNFPLCAPGVLGTLGSGGRVVLAPTPDPATTFPLIEREGVTATGLVPALVIAWLDWAAAHPEERARLTSLELIQVGGARLQPEVAARVGPGLGCTLQQVLGMAEGLCVFTRHDDSPEVVLHTVGRPISPADEVRIVGHDDAEVPDGEPGELLTRGPYTIRGYYQAPDHNERAFTDDGFYRTGDVVRRHPSGNLVVEGRIKDLINRGGEKISAEEIENHLLAHPNVLNAAVVAMPDPVLGERVCAYLLLHPGQHLGLDEVVVFMASRSVAKFKYPERVEVVETFPVTAVGKVDKVALRADITAKLARTTRPELRAHALLT